MNDEEEQRKMDRFDLRVLRWITCICLIVAIVLTVTGVFLLPFSIGWFAGQLFYTWWLDPRSSFNNGS